jgi:LacI family transcriptional regulator, repressor for deo operon, udp, cdd, tsx, nupC, and nupG
MTDDEMHSPVTSVDVAHRAGVSQAAVSLVFGGKATGRVGKHTQEVILQAARELGYRPNSAARTLRSGRSRLIVLAVPDVSNPYFAAVLRGAEQVARKLGYAVMLASVRDEYDWQQVVLDALSSRSVDGFLIFTLCPPLEGVYTALQGKAVLVDAASSAFPSLLLDIEAGMHAAMAHLLHSGHTKIAHLAAAVDADTFRLRRSTYLDALSAAGLAVPVAYQQSASFTIENARQAACRILEGPSPPSAIVCDSDVLAVGVYKAAKDLHYRIPEDLSVVGFDDSIIARLLDPELTTVAIPTTDIGEQAFLLLLAVLEKGHVPAQVMIALELVVRASTTRTKDNHEGSDNRCVTIS